MDVTLSLRTLRLVVAFSKLNIIVCECESYTNML